MGESKVLKNQTPCPHRNELVGSRFCLTRCLDHLSRTWSDHVKCGAQAEIKTEPCPACGKSLVLPGEFFDACTKMREHTDSSKVVLSMDALLNNKSLLEGVRGFIKQIDTEEALDGQD